jgi:hypothetical protein
MFLLTRVERSIMGTRLWAGGRQCCGGALAAAVLACLLLSACAPLPLSVTPTATPRTTLGHFVGGFGIYTASDANAAAAAGVTTAFDYGSVTSTTSAALQAVKMRRIEAQPWSLLLAYECSRLSEMERGWSVCTNRDPVATQQDLLSAVTAYLHGVQHDPGVEGYWILDDWPSFDPGAARTSLQAITRLAHQLTPGRPTICGFGAQLHADGTSQFDPTAAENYAPGACDMVALYIYAASVRYPVHIPTAFDWSMARLLPRMEQALRAQGWDAAKVPLIGVAQAWGGVRTDAPGLIDLAPSTADVAEQSASFCHNGAVGIVYYAWSSSNMREMQTPANNAQIRDGVERGIAACKSVWARTP